MSYFCGLGIGKVFLLCVALAGLTQWDSTAYLEGARRCLSDVWSLGRARLGLVSWVTFSHFSLIALPCGLFRIVHLLSWWLWLPRFQGGCCHFSSRLDLELA